MKKFFVAVLLLAVMSITGCGGQSDSENGAKDAQTLVIGLDDHYAPLGFRNEKGEIVGFDIDLAKEVGKRMGVRFVFKPIDWDNKREEITSGEIDMLWNGTDITEDRKEYLIYTRPYLENRQILLVKMGNEKNVHTAGDLEGKVVGTQAGSSSTNYVNDNEKLKNGFSEFKVYRNFKDAFEELDSGKVDVLICDEIAARYEISKVPSKFEIIETTIGPVCEIGIGFRKEDIELRDKVQQTFDAMVKDGTARKISEQWFQADLIKHKR